MKALLLHRSLAVCSALLASVLAAASASHVTLVPANATWKHLGSGTDLGTAWTAAGFNDSSWSAGPAQLGYGDGDESTVVTTPSPRPPTVYFRRSVSIPGGLTGATVRLLRDDGAVVYVNGVEVLRNNMPAGPVTFHTLATVSVGGAEETSAFIESAISPAPFVAGENLIAVEVHQVNLASTDMSFALELLGEFGFPPPTVVTVAATQPHTREVPDWSDQPLIPGVFQITRTGPTNIPLTVYFQLGGTATNGLDYEEMTNHVVIPAGSAHATLFVTPRYDELHEGTETVVLTLETPICIAIFPPPPECYEVGLPAQATVFIADAPAGNQPPTVNIISPAHHDLFIGPTNITLRAHAADADGQVVRVEFFELPGSNSLGLAQLDNTGAYTLVWSNVTPVGAHSIRAYATDDAGNVGVSGLVTIGVVRDLGPLPVISVVATIPTASESGPSNAVFTLRRSPVTNINLVVAYELNGTAHSGDDYVHPGGLAYFDPNQEFVEVMIEPIDDLVFEGPESVVLTLLPLVPPPGPVIPSFPPPRPTYALDPAHASATALIADNDTPPPVTTLIATGSVWRFLDDGSDQGSAWTHPNFNDDAWPAGPAQLGYGDGDEATVVSFGPDAANKFITTYFRRSFEISNAALVAHLTGRLTEDDGAVVYLNGFEVFRSNLPHGPVSNHTLALLAPDNHEVEFTVPARFLVHGRNVIAVEMHQASVVSSDLSFDLELRGTPGRRPPWLTLPPVHHEAWLTNGCRLVLEGDAPARCVVECSTNLIHWMPIRTNILSGAAVEVIDPDAGVPARKFYRVRMD